MRFETSQHMKLGQQMKLAPRMIQSMEILQMPLAELEERIEQELESNPTLELMEQRPDEDAIDRTRDDSGDDAGAAEFDMDASGADDFARLDEFESANPDAAENAFAERDFAEQPDRLRTRDDSRHESPYSASRLEGERDGKADAMAAAPARAASLDQQLLEQWGLVDVDERLRPLGRAIIGFLDEDGYLRTPLEDVAERSPAAIGAHTKIDGNAPTAADWELALQAVQLLLEPAGVAARDARECLLLQLDALLDAEAERGAGRDDELPSETISDIAVARALVGEHLEDLMKNRLPKIAAKTGHDLDEIKRGIELMRRLSLAPARRLVVEENRTITPDAIVEYDDEHDRYVAYLADHRWQNLQINREYALMSKDRGVEKRDREFLRKNLSNAQWLLDAVGQRRHTLLRVINVVIEEQREFFDYGPEALKPLPMTQVAERLGIHVATVSRAVSEKYLLSPRGVVPLRSFFTGGLSTDSGEDMSYDAVRAALREIIDNEDKAKPFSDEALVTQLTERGIEIARRTVAKYRGLMNIPSARMRKQY